MSSIKLKNITETLTSLNRNRSDEIKTLLSSTCTDSKKLYINIQSIQNKYVLSVSERAERGLEYRDRFFNSKNVNIVCSYYEIWNRFEKDTYFLERAYFHMYLLNQDSSGQESNDEYILLHTDPNDNGSNYKKGPHLHIKYASDPIPKAHIALNNENLVEVLKSKKSLTRSLKLAIDMLSEEILMQVI